LNIPTVVTASPDHRNDEEADPVLPATPGLDSKTAKLPPLAPGCPHAMDDSMTLTLSAKVNPTPVTSKVKACPAKGRKIPPLPSCTDAGFATPVKKNEITNIHGLMHMKELSVIVLTDGLESPA
jgi:hypothetical protein